MRWRQKQKHFRALLPISPPYFVCGKNFCEQKIPSKKLEKLKQLSTSSGMQNSY
jgi:hypothetical protein